MPDSADLLLASPRGPRLKGRLALCVLAVGLPALACSMGEPTPPNLCSAALQADGLKPDPDRKGTRSVACTNSWSDSERGEGEATVEVSEQWDLNADAVARQTQLYKVKFRKTDAGWVPLDVSPDGDSRDELYQGQSVPPKDWLLRPFGPQLQLPEVDIALAVPSSWFASASTPGQDVTDEQFGWFLSGPQNAEGPAGACDRPLPGDGWMMVEVSLDELRFAGQHVLYLRDGMPPADATVPGAGIASLVEPMGKQGEMAGGLAAGAKCAHTPRVLIAADKRVPASTIRYIVYSANEAGFNEYYLLVDGGSHRVPGFPAVANVPQVDIGVVAPLGPIVATASNGCFWAVGPTRDADVTASVRSQASATAATYPPPHGAFVSVVRIGQLPQDCGGPPIELGVFGDNGGGGIVTVGADPVVLGIDMSAVTAVIEKNMGQLRYCYQRELTKSPTVAGKLTVKFIIDKDGTVSSAVTESSTLGSDLLESCINGRFMRFQFPEPNGAGGATGSYPLLFAPGAAPGAEVALNDGSSPEPAATWEGLVGCKFGETYTVCVDHAAVSLPPPENGFAFFKGLVVAGARTEGAYFFDARSGRLSSVAYDFPSNESMQTVRGRLETMFGPPTSLDVEGMPGYAWPDSRLHVNLSEMGGRTNLNISLKAAYKSEWR